MGPSGITDFMKERMKIPPDVRDIIKTENRRMEAILQENNYIYEGTDMWKDAKARRR